MCQIANGERTGMTSSPTLQDYLQSAQTILTNLLRLLEFADARIESAVADGQIFFQIETADAGRIIGRNSQTLDAIQFLLNRLFSRQYEESPYCVVDAGQYRARRREKLLADALGLWPACARTVDPAACRCSTPWNGASFIRPGTAPISHPRTKTPRAQAGGDFPRGIRTGRTGAGCPRPRSPPDALGPTPFTTPPGRD